MALPIRDQLKYWGVATAVFLVLLWFLGDVLVPFLLGGAIAYVPGTGGTGFRVTLPRAQALAAQ